MKFIILGCGSSMGVPRPDGFFEIVTQIIKRITEQDAQLYSKLHMKIF